MISVRKIFDAIVTEYGKFAAEIGISSFTAIPVSGFKGDNITEAPSSNMPWYAGPALIAHLENIEIAATAAQEKSFRMPVQWVNRPNLDFRGFSGLVSGGTIKPGDPIRIVPSGKNSTVKSIVTLDGTLDEAVAGQSVTITLVDEVDCSRGDVIAAAGDPPEVSDQFESTIVWMSEEALKPGRGYWLKLATQTVSASVQEPKFEINVNTMEHLAAKTLELNAIGVAEVHTDKPIVFESYTGQLRTWWVYSGRQDYQCDGRRRHAAFQPSTGRQCPLAADYNIAGRTCIAQKPGRRACFGSPVSQARENLR